MRATLVISSLGHSRGLGTATASVAFSMCTAMKLKRVSDQVVVITGASSGIGRETALRFANRGARVVLASRDLPSLQTLSDEISGFGGSALASRCDVSSYDDVQNLASAAVARYGRIDTWVNNAAIALIAPFASTAPEEFRRVVDVNLMGQVYGAYAALPHLTRAGGGALICVTSIEAQVSAPLQSAYAASKHAVVGFVDALRREILHDGLPISVTNVMPASINTPLFASARAKIGHKPQGPPPIYPPRVVAEAIIYAATHPVRDIYAGGAARAMSLAQRVSPRLMDRILSSDRFGYQLQYADAPGPSELHDNFYEPSDDPRVEGDYTGRSRTFSLHHALTTRRRWVALLAGVAAGSFLVTRARRPRPALDQRLTAKTGAD